MPNSSRMPIEQLAVFANMRSDVFYKTHEWRKLRYQILVQNGNQCQLCGAKASNGYELNVDHILPRYLYPEKCLNPRNLQILCKQCHLGKGTEFLDDCRNRVTRTSEGLETMLALLPRHLILEHRPPSSRHEMKRLQDGAKSITEGKSPTKRWRRFVAFCFTEKLAYRGASHIKVKDFFNSKSAKNEKLAIFLQTAQGHKSPNDFFFDIHGCVFPFALKTLVKGGSNDE